MGNSASTAGAAGGKQAKEDNAAGGVAPPRVAFGEQEQQKSRAQQLDDQLGYDRPAIKRGDTLNQQIHKLQHDLGEKKKEIQEMTDDSGVRAKLAMAQENLQKLRKVVQKYSADGMYGTMEYNLKQAEFKAMQQEVERLRREAQKMDMKNKQKKRREGRGKEGESSKVSAGGLNRVPTWRRNVEHAKSNFKKNWRGFVMVKNQVDATTMAAQGKGGKFMRMEELETQGVLISQILQEKASWFAELQMLLIEKQQKMEALPIGMGQKASRLTPVVKDPEDKLVSEVLVGPSWLWRRDRMPLCNPMLVLETGSPKRKKTVETTSKKASEYVPEETGENRPEETVAALGNENQLELWANQQEARCRKTEEATLQDVGNTLQMIVNRANSSMLDEQSSFSMPVIHDILAYQMTGGLERMAYLADLKDMVSGGQFALQVHCAESMALYPSGSTESLLHMDPWLTCEMAAPEQVLAGERLMGFTYFRRAMIRLSMTVQDLGGHPALHSTTLLLHICQEDVKKTEEELVDNGFFGFNIDNVFLVPAKTEAGFTWSEDMRMFVLDAGSRRTTGGDGHAMQQLVVPYEALKFLPSGKTEKQKQTVMSFLKDKKVKWMHSFHVDDAKALQPGGTLDHTGLAFAIKEQKTNQSNMAVEVHDVNSLAEMQYRGSVLLKKHGGDAAKGSAAKRAALHKMHECLSPPIIAKMERLRKRCGGKLMVGTNRYYFYVPDLMEILLEQHLFRVTLEMAGTAVYPRRFMMDITNATQAACIALRSSTSAPPTPARPFWYGRDVSLILKKADQEPALRAAVGTYIKDMSAAWQPAEDLMERMYSKYQKKMVDMPRIIVFFVTDNAACRKAFDLVAGIMQTTISARDHWHIVTSVRRAHNQEAAQDLLDSFHDETLGGLNTTRKVLVRGDSKLHETLSDYAHKVRASLLVFGSTNLAAGAGKRALGSVTLTALKAIALPILIVKDDTRRTDLKKYLSVSSNKVRACVHVTPTCGDLLDFVGSMMLDYKHRRDNVVLCRPDAIDESKRGEKVSSKFVLDHFTNQAREMNLQPVTKALLGKAQDSLPTAAEGVEAHFLAVQAPNNRSLPEWLAKVIQHTKCAILVFKDKSVTLS